MCTGMVYPDLVMEAFSNGADGVMIMGCHPGECHYLDGNTKAIARAGVISEVLGDIGVDPQRFELQWISSAEASVFARQVTDFTNRILRLGPHIIGPYPEVGNHGFKKA
jgi:coenzyme F420-reducing hydrogenase delta subunit